MAAVSVKIADLPQVQAAMADATEMIRRLRELAQEWEPHVRCPQCGKRFSESACGPGHAVVWALVYPVEAAGPSDEARIREAMAEAKDHPGRIVMR